LVRKSPGLKTSHTTIPDLSATALLGAMAVNLDALKAAQAKGQTAGLIPKPGSPPPLRLEIDDFIQDTELANLYFLAMASYMSEEAAKTPFSYFEISGIHGQPNRSWNRQPQSTEWVANTRNGDARKYSYCAHSSLVFPTWHRAYLAQFEVWHPFLLTVSPLNRCTARPLCPRRCIGPGSQGREGLGSFPHPVL